MVNKYYPPHLGGIEFHVRDLAEALAARPGFGARVVVANEKRKTVHEILNGVDVVRLSRLLAVSSTPVALGMPAEIRAQRSEDPPADLIHLHFPYPWGDFSWLLAKPGLPAVMTYHSDIVRQERMLRLYRPILERVLERVDLVIASSPDMVEHSEFLRRVAAKCRVVPFGIHAEAYAETPEVLRRADGLRSRHSRPIVLFVGRLIYYKGADVLVKAMADVDADLVMIGKGPLEGELERLAASLGVSERVTFLPPVDDEDLSAWYHAADVFCLPSVARSEAFGLVQLEAHASGTPVVSTTLTTGVPFVNPDGVTGFTVPPGDVDALAEALRKLVDDPTLRERMGAAARRRVLESFTTERMVDDTVAVYREAIEGKA